MSAVTQYQDIGVKQTDGMRVGSAATDKIGFYGAAPVVQQAAITAAPTDTTTLIAAVVFIDAKLKTLGLTA
jgi:hypothetical protein